jgi:hypothetical protein
VLAPPIIRKQERIPVTEAEEKARGEIQESRERLKVSEGQINGRGLKIIFSADY